MEASANSVPLKTSACRVLIRRWAKAEKPQSELIGSHPMSAGAIGKQIQLLLFDTIFHVTPGAIKLLV